MKCRSAGVASVAGGLVDLVAKSRGDGGNRNKDMVARPLNGGGIFIDKVSSGSQSLSHSNSSVQLASVYNMASDLKNVRLKYTSSSHIHQNSDKLASSKDINSEDDCKTSGAEPNAENKSEIKEFAEADHPSSLEIAKSDNKLSYETSPENSSIKEHERSLVELNLKRGGGLKSPLKTALKSPKNRIFQSSVVESFQHQISAVLTSATQEDDEKCRVDEVCALF